MPQNVLLGIFLPVFGEKLLILSIGSVTYLTILGSFLEL